MRLVQGKSLPACSIQSAWDATHRAQKTQESLKRSKKEPFLLSVMLFGVISPLRHFSYSVVCALSLSTTVLSGVNAPPALSLPQMFSLLNRFIPLTLKRASPHFHLCLHSVQGKFLLRADLFLTSKGIRLSTDSDRKAEQNISEAELAWELCYVPTGGQRPLPDSLHCQTVQKGSGSGPEPLLLCLFPGLAPQLTQHHLPVIQDTEAKSEQAKQDWKAPCPTKGSDPQSARTVGVGKTHLSELHGSFLREILSLCIPSPKARLAAAQTQHF